MTCSRWAGCAGNCRSYSGLFLSAAVRFRPYPLVTAGFYSKDMIIWQVYASTRGGVWLWAAAIAGALLTSMYTFRMVTLTFFGPLGKEVSRLPGWRMSLPLVVLAVLSIIAGFVDVPRILGGVPGFVGFSGKGPSCCRARTRTDVGGRPVRDLFGRRLFGRHRIDRPAHARGLVPVYRKAYRIGPRGGTAPPFGLPAGASTGL